MLANALNKALNRYLQLDAQSRERLSQLEGKTISVEIHPLAYRLQCVFTQARAFIQETEVLQADVSIKGTPWQFLNVFTASGAEKAKFAGELDIVGDSEIAQQVMNLFDELDIDWEEHLSRFIGDVPSFYLSNAWRKLTQVRKRVANILVKDIDEYVHEERQWVPSRESLREFFAEVDETRMQVDRLEARINLLKQLSE
jgi:ubiquinone biosynthesis protein UbiJ